MSLPEEAAVNIGMDGLSWQERNSQEQTHLSQGAIREDIRHGAWLPTVARESVLVPALTQSSCPVRQQKPISKNGTYLVPGHVRTSVFAYLVPGHVRTSRPLRALLSARSGKGGPPKHAHAALGASLIQSQLHLRRSGMYPRSMSIRGCCMRFSAARSSSPTNPHGRHVPGGLGAFRFDSVLISATACLPQSPRPRTTVASLLVFTSRPEG